MKEHLRFVTLNSGRCLQCGFSRLEEEKAAGGKAGLYAQMYGVKNSPLVMGATVGM